MPSSSIQSILFQEFEYSQAAETWVPAQESGWLDYDAARQNYPWTLLPSAGCKYVQAWAADHAGNISHFPHRDFITYVPPTDHVAQGQARSYRYFLNAGDRLTVRLEPLSGDPDLYVWPPDADTRPPWVSNQATGIDEVSFTVPIQGRYQVEVYGYTTAAYQLAVQIDAGGLKQTDQSAARSHISQTKIQLTAPILPLDSEPSDILSDDPPGPRMQIFLPVVMH